MATDTTAAAGELPRLRILVADDNVAAAQVLALALDMLGQSTRVVHDGEAALAAAAEFRPELAILDIGMPKLDGLALARALRADPAHAGLELVALSGWGQPQDRALALAAGFDRHVSKPIGIEALEDIVRDAARRLATRAEPS